MALIEINLYSQVLNLEVPVNVILPQDAEPPYKTIWLYHGGTGDHTLWERYTDMERFVRERGIAVVTPTAHKSLFTDMLHGQEYGKFMGEELIDRLREIFPCLSTAREDNYVAGLSNGAYGCLRIGMRYPEKFAAIGAFSGGDFADQYWTDDGTYRGRRHVMVFGEGNPGESEHGVKYLARRVVQQGGPYPRIFHVAGELEPGGQGNGMTDFFRDLPFEYRFRVYPGVGHEWELWEEAFHDFVDEFLGIKPVVTKYYV